MKYLFMGLGLGLVVGAVGMWWYMQGQLTRCVADKQAAMAYDAWLHEAAIAGMRHAAMENELRVELSAMTKQYQAAKLALASYREELAELRADYAKLAGAKVDLTIPSKAASVYGITVHPYYNSDAVVLENVKTYIPIEQVAKEAAQHPAPWWQTLKAEWLRLATRGK